MVMKEFTVSLGRQTSSQIITIYKRLDTVMRESGKQGEMRKAIHRSLRMDRNLSDK